jgi:hypothetical protein
MRTADAMTTPSEAEVRLLAEALHPDGEGPVVDCCMGSTFEHLYPPIEAESKHRAAHLEDAAELLGHLPEGWRLTNEPSCTPEERATLDALARLPEMGAIQRHVGFWRATVPVGDPRLAVIATGDTPAAAIDAALEDPQP